MKKNTGLLAAALLMATSAIGPGFLNNTALFTGQLGASFGFVILVSILLDIGAQLNIWRVVVMSGRRAQDLANAVLPGLGYLLAAMVAIGGLVFNIGNIAGCGLGLEALTGLPVKWGASLSVGIALYVFWSKDAGKAMDVLVKTLGLAMLVLVVYVVIFSGPPLREAVYRTVWPEKINVKMIIALVGGTVGGYISFAGAHRLLDAGIATGAPGNDVLAKVNRSAVTGIVLTSLVRYLLFLAALGVVASGVVLDNHNTAAAVFSAAAGKIGYRFFGMVMWAAAITSVVGASYTSVSFLKTFSTRLRQRERWLITCFILVSAVVFLWRSESPGFILVTAGALNGLILPVALAVMLIAATRNRFFKDYHHPLWLQVVGWLVVLVVGWMSYTLLAGLF